MDGASPRTTFSVTAAPSEGVIRAFGGRGTPVLLPGGRGASWVVGDLVLKPLDMTSDQLSWQADLLGSITCRGFRIARPRRARDGRLVVDGWSGWERVEGRHEGRRWGDIIAAGERFHAAVAQITRPPFLDRRKSAWSHGDRAAWGELPDSSFRNREHIPALLSVRRPLQGRAQLIHGDLTGNVLFAEGLAPAIIDLSPYWRPPAFASAIVVADALCWEGADERILEVVSHLEAFGQHLVRALIYRIVADASMRPGTGPHRDGPDPYRKAVELAIRLAQRN